MPLLIFNIDLKSRLVLLAFMQFTDENALQRMMEQLKSQTAGVQLFGLYNSLGISDEIKDCRPFLKDRSHKYPSLTSSGH